MADIKLGASALGGFYLGSVSVNKIYLGNTEIFSESEPFDSGILQNGTFDDSTGVFVPSGGWSVSGGTLDKDASGDKFVRLNLSTDMIVGNTYDITFTISNASTARTAWYAGNQNELIEGNTNYGNGTHIIRGYTHTVADRGEISIKGSNSGGGGPFSIDNISVVSRNVYPYDNAVGANDIDSNDGWSASSIFFTNSVASTDAGQDFSIAIESRSTSASNTGYRFNKLPGLTVGTPYKAIIRYKNTSTTTPVQHPFNSWREVSDVTYPGGTFSTGQWVEAEVLFTPNDPVNDAEMRFYPLANAAGGRTDGDVLEISSIIIEKVIFDGGFVINGGFDDSIDLTLGSSWTVSEGVATYDAVQDDSQLKLDLTTLTNGNNYNLTFDVIGDGGRMEIKCSGDNFLTAQTISSFTNRNAGTYTIPFTANDDHTIIRFKGDNGLGGAFSLDNISIVVTDAILDASPVGYFTPESIVDSGGAVSEWTDVVNGYNFVTNLGSPSKVLDGGVDAVLFDGVDDMMQTSDTSHFDFNPTVDEFSIVMKISGAASSNTVMLHRGSASSANTSTYQYAAAFRTDRQIVSVGGAGSTNFSSPRATGTDDLIIITVSTTTVTVRINGTDVYTFTPGSNNYDTLTSIGGRNSSNLSYVPVTYQRLAFFDKVLSAGEITTIEDEFIPVELINVSASAANIDSLEANSYGITNDSEWQENGATRGIETSEVKSGTYSLSVTGARYAVVNFRPIVSYFTTGNRYRFTFNMKSSEPTAFAEIAAGFTNFSSGTNGTSKVRLDDQPLSDANGWKELIIEAEFTGTLPLINISPRDTTGSSVTVYLDEFKIEKL